MRSLPYGRLTSDFGRGSKPCCTDRLWQSEAYGNGNCLNRRLRNDEPAADLSIALAIVSSLKDVIVPDDVLAFGEIGLAGEIRSVVACDQRIKEASKLGFKKCVIPYHNYKKLSKSVLDLMEVVPAKTVRQAFEVLIN